MKDYKYRQAQQKLTYLNDYSHLFYLNRTAKILNSIYIVLPKF
jgi:hypothetical protein